MHNFALEELTAKNYSEFLDQVEVSDIFQDTRWHQVSQIKGWGSPKYLVWLNKKDKQVLFAFSAHSNKSRYLGDYLISQHSPLIHPRYLGKQDLLADWGDPSLDADLLLQWRSFVAAVSDWAKSKRYGRIIWEPLLVHRSPLATVLYNQGFQRQTFAILPTYPLFIDLQRPEEDLLASYSKNTRYYIRRALKKEVSIEFWFPQVGEDLESHNFYKAFRKLILTASNRQDYDIPVEKFFKSGLAKFAGTNQVFIAVAKYKDEIVSANFSQYHRNWAGSYYTANSRKHSKLRASYLLKHETIIKAKQLGAKVFDMWGHIPNLPKSHPEYGYGRFKRSFNPIDKEFVGRVILPLDLRNKLVLRFLENK